MFTVFLTTIAVYVEYLRLEAILGLLTVGVCLLSFFYLLGVVISFFFFLTRRWHGGRSLCLFISTFLALGWPYWLWKWLCK